MISNDERREVARRLRELDYSDLQESLICAYLDALGIEGYEDWVGIAHRLADLIEPSESGQNRDRNQDSVQKESHIVQIDHECDRDALLKLADDLDGMGDGSMYDPCISDEYGIASRIREILGV